MSNVMINTEKWINDLNQTLAKAAYVTPSHDSCFDDLVLAYLDFCHIHKDMTLKSIRHELRYTHYFLDWITDGHSIDNITRIQPKHITEFIGYLRDKGLSDCSVCHHFVTLKHFFEYLVEMNLVAANPTKDIHIKAVKAAPRQLLSIEQRNDILSTKPIGSTDFYRSRNYAIMCIVFSTGLRLQEITELMVSDINLSGGTVMICGKGGRNILSKHRLCFLDQTAVTALDTYISVHHPSESPWLFTDSKGIRLNQMSYQQTVANYGLAANIDIRVNFQVLRASFASWMVAQGMDPIALRQLMGHESIRTTFSCYVSMQESHVRDTWARTNPLAKLLGGIHNDKINH